MNNNSGMIVTGRNAIVQDNVFNIIAAPIMTRIMCTRESKKTETRLIVGRSSRGKTTFFTRFRLFSIRTLDLLTLLENMLNIAIPENNIIAYGSPWSGKHRLENNIAVPLKAVAFLQRGTRNHIRQVTPQEIYVNIIEQTFKPEDPQKIALILKLIDKMIQNTRFYIMTCNMEKEAAVVASSSMMQIF